MNYVARASTLEAKPVTLGGQALMAVLLDGAPMLVNAEAFGALYAEQQQEPPTPLPFRLNAPAKKPTAEAKKAAPVKTVAGPGPTAVLIALVTEYPSTTAELQDRLLDRIGREKVNKTNRDWAYQAISAALENGKLIKKTDSETQLTRIHLAHGVAS